MAGRWPRATIEIEAPIEVVWAIMLDTGSYAEWNPFIVRIETSEPPVVGAPIKLHVRWSNGGSTTSPERITVIEPPSTTEQNDSGAVATATLAYVYEGLPAKLGLVRGTRYQRLSQAPGGPTRYDTVEEFSGPLVRLAGPNRVADGFRRHAEALKARAEAG